MKSLASNKKANFNYEILEEIEAGIVLTGAEVKSVKQGHISLKESFATFRGNEIMLTNAHISPYKPAGKENSEPTRARKMLLKKSEIEKLRSKAQTEGLTLIPIKVYVKRGLVKILLGLSRGKRKYDKRETIKKREQEREITRALKNA